jgi:DNA-binding IscR family transcriptional regulator
MPLLPPEAVLAIAAVTYVALDAQRALIRRPTRGKALSVRLGVPSRHLERVLQALSRHGTLNSTPGPRGDYDLAREGRCITAADILRAVGPAAEMECTAAVDSALLLWQAEEVFCAQLARINVVTTPVVACRQICGPAAEPPLSDCICFSGARLPVFSGAIVTMGANFPFPILPRIVAELGRIFELLLGNVSAEPAQRPIVGQRAPGNRIVAVAETHEAAKAHDGVGHASRQLVDDEVIDLADVLAIG